MLTQEKLNARFARKVKRGDVNRRLARIEQDTLSSIRKNRMRARKLLTKES